MTSTYTMKPYEIAFGLIAVVVLLEVTRRVMGWLLVIVALCALVYAYFGEYITIPELTHHGFRFEHVLDYMYMTDNGIWGVALGVAAAYIVLFVIFGAFAERAGAADFFIHFANGIAGHTRGRPAKVAVFSSGLIGSVTGSSVAKCLHHRPVRHPAHEAARLPAEHRRGGRGAGLERGADHAAHPRRGGVHRRRPHRGAVRQGRARQPDPRGALLRRTVLVHPPGGVQERAGRYSPRGAPRSGKDPAPGRASAVAARRAHRMLVVRVLADPLGVLRYRVHGAGQLGAQGDPARAAGRSWRRWKRALGGRC